MEITPTARIGEIAAHHPLATRVFARHGIDFCCGGGVPLQKACAARGLDAPAVVSEIEREIAGAPVEIDWMAAPLDQLVEHIITTYHEGLREELPRLEAMAPRLPR